MIILTAIARKDMIQRSHGRSSEYLEALQSCYLWDDFEHVWFDRASAGWKRAIEISKNENKSIIRYRWGIGDVVYFAIKWTGLKLLIKGKTSCCACNKRRKKLNQWGWNLLRKFNRV